MRQSDDMTPQINLTHLRFFCDTVIYGSISEAAKKNYISQSAVSQAISKLETIFGVQLIFQNRQKIQPTDEGKILLKQSQTIFRDIKNTFDLVNQNKEADAGCVKFATTKSLGMSLFASTYTSIKENLPDLEFSFRMGGLTLIRTAVKHEDVDFAIVVYDDVNFGQFEKYPLRKGKFNLYKSKKTPAEAIHNEIFVSDPECIYVPELKNFLEDRGLEPGKLTSLRGWDLVARFTELNLGVGFFPEHLLLGNRYPNIEIHPTEIPTYEYEICAIFNKGVKLSKAALSFLELFKTG